MEEILVAIIGGGPTGLYAASRLEVAKIPYVLLEATSTLGGQSQTLYPEKEVVDIPLFPPLKAKEVINALKATINPKNLRLETPVTSLKEDDEGVTLVTPIETFHAKHVLLCTGLGFHKPRTMGLEKEEECHNILYSLLDPSLMKDKEVAIFGGGDSALDWAKGLSKIAKKVSLIHRRTEFRGNPETIKGCHVDLYLPYIPLSINYQDEMCQSIVIQNVSDNSTLTLKTDYVLVNFGQVPSPSTFSLPLSSKGFGVLTNEHYEATPHIYVAGDCLYSENKKKRIAPAMEEVDAIMASLLKRVL